MTEASKTLISSIFQLVELGHLSFSAANPVKSIIQVDENSTKSCYEEEYCPHTKTVFLYQTINMFFYRSPQGTWEKKKLRFCEISQKFILIFFLPCSLRGSVVFNGVNVGIATLGLWGLPQVAPRGTVVFATSVLAVFFSLYVAPCITMQEEELQQSYRWVKYIWIY